MKLTAAQQKAILAALVATGGPFDPAATYVGVFNSVTDKGEDTLLSDVTEATGAMATRHAVTAYSGPYEISTGLWGMVGTLCRFTPASAGEAQSIAGYFLASALTAGNLLAFEQIPPVPLADATNSLAIVFQVTVDQNGQWSATTTIAN